MFLSDSDSANSLMGALTAEEIMKNLDTSVPSTPTLPGVSALYVYPFVTWFADLMVQFALSLAFGPGFKFRRPGIKLSPPKPSKGDSSS